MEIPPNIVVYQIVDKQNIKMKNRHIIGQCNKYFIAFYNAIVNN